MGLRLARAIGYILFCIAHIDIFLNSLFHLLLGGCGSGEVCTATWLSGFKIFQKPGKKYIVKISTLEKSQVNSEQQQCFPESTTTVFSKGQEGEKREIGCFRCF